MHTTRNLFIGGVILLLAGAFSWYVFFGIQPDLEIFDTFPRKEPKLFELQVPFFPAIADVGEISQKSLPNEVKEIIPSNSRNITSREIPSGYLIFGIIPGNIADIYLNYGHQLAPLGWKTSSGGHNETGAIREFENTAYRVRSLFTVKEETEYVNFGIFIIKK